MKELTIRRPDDFHLHLRQGELLRTVAPHSAHFARGLVMPNTTPPILAADQLKAYREEILAAANQQFEPLMTIKITSATTPEIVREARLAGAIAGKLYPEGVTTNSEDGVRDLSSLVPVFVAMAEVGMVLCVHGETPGIFCLDREADFVENSLPDIVDASPQLKIVLEHLSTALAVEWVRSQKSNVGATITVHHLLLSLDDLVGGKLEPHHFCKPIVKRREDRAALLEAATSGDPRFFLGTDSAPHDREDKECAGGAAGVFSAPVAMGLLAEIFESQKALDRLEDFTSTYGAEFYKLPQSKGALRLIRDPWIVPPEFGGVVPLRANQRMEWRVEKSETM